MRNVQFLLRNNVHFEQFVASVYPNVIQLNKANSSDIKAAFLDFGIVYLQWMSFFKHYYKRDDFDNFDFPFLNGDLPRSTTYGVYIYIAACSFR